MGTKAIVKEWYDANGAPFLHNKQVMSDFFSAIIDPTAKKCLSHSDKRELHSWGQSQRGGSFVVDTDPGDVHKEAIIYHKYLLAFWPKSDQFSTLLRIDEKIAVDFLCTHMSGSDYDVELFAKNVKELVEKICKKSNSYIIFSNTYTLKVLEILEIMNSLEITKRFIGVAMRMRTPEDKAFSTKIAHKLADLLIKYGWNALEENFEHFAHVISRENQINSCRIIKVCELSSLIEMRRLLGEILPKFRQRLL